MADIQKFLQTLESRGYHVHYFPTAREAADYLDGQLDQTSIAFGGSVTLKELGLYPRLSTHNQVLWHWEGGSLADAAHTKIYLTSVNAAAETGELVNIDGNCNRIASSVFGHEKVYLVFGVNKLAPDFDQAVWRARNIAAPKNCRRLGRANPCAVKADRCYDCNSSQRSCRVMTVFWYPPSLQETHVVLIGEALGY